MLLRSRANLLGPAVKDTIGEDIVFHLGIVKTIAQIPVELPHHVGRDLHRIGLFVGIERELIDVRAAVAINARPRLSKPEMYLPTSTVSAPPPVVSATDL